MRFRFPVFLVSALFLVGCGSDVSSRTGDRPETFEANFTTWATMRDGVRLATDVQLPQGFEVGTSQPYPTILLRTPYGKTSGDPNLIRAWAREQGIAYVVQDTRGRASSEGIDEVFQDDGFGLRQDGYDTVEWIAEQAWSNGRVCTMGPSALGITQTLMAAANPPSLTCQFILVAPSDMYAHATYQGGVLREELITSWLEFQESDTFLDVILEHPEYGDRWEELNALERLDEIQVPAIHVGGWFDIFSEGTLTSFQRRQYEGGEGARGQQKLVMTPGDHIQTALFLTHSGPHTNRQVSRLNVKALAQRWFAHHLLDIDTGVMDEPDVRYFQMFGGREDGQWRTAVDWPPPATQWTLALHDGGKLGTASPAAAAVTGFTHDPADPLVTVGGRNLFSTSGDVNQGPLTAETQKRLLFLSGPLERDVPVAGEVTAQLAGALDGEDGHWVLQLLDVSPDGSVHKLVTEGSLRAQLRQGVTTAIPVTPGSVELYPISVYSTAWTFPKGHRIGLAISGANAPRLETYPHERAFTVHLNGDSILRLPIVE